MFANPSGIHRNVECGLVSYWKEFPTSGFGIQRKLIPTPLVSVSVFASVVHAVAQVEITQVYVNQEDNPIETFYYFPLDSNGAVVHFHAEIEGRKIKGVVKAHEEAKAAYEKAVNDHQTAFLGVQNKQDIFKIRIGYLKPGTQVKIVIGYVTEVKNEKGSSSLRFFLPTTVAPRYIPPTENDPKGRELADMKFSNNSPAQIAIQVNVVLQGAIQKVESPSHSILVTEKGPVPEKSNWSRSIVQLKGLTTDMDRDFVLLITPEENQKPKMYIEKIEKEGKKSMAAMAYLIPSFKLDDQKTELIFLLDQSGSMQGHSMDLAKKALILFLHSLPVDCYFNVIGFGSTFSSLFPNSVIYNDIHLSTALSYARGLTANMGGTEIFRPLQHIYNLPNIPGYLRQIFVLTDGEVSNTEQVIGLTKIYAHRIRLFALGIGNSASHHLVEGLASSGGGTSVFVTINEPIESKVLQQLKNAVEPSLTDISVEWDGLPAATTTVDADQDKTPKEVAVNTEKTLFGYRKTIGENPTPSQIKLQDRPFKQAPQKIPPIFDGSQMVIFGIFDDEKLPTGVTITAASPDGPLSIKIPLSDENDVGPTGMLHNLAAIKIIREMEMNFTALEILNFDYFSRDRTMTPERIKSEIVKLACTHAIASRFTSFVAIDDQHGEVSQNWAMETRCVPSQLPQGYGTPTPFCFSRQNFQSPFQYYSNAVSSFSFGSQQQSTGTLFGGPQVPSTGSVFGGPQAPSMGTVFGGPQTPSTGALFGGPQPPSTKPLFGGSQQPSTVPLFGGSQQPSTGSVFGGSQQQSTGLLFGSSPQPAASLGFGQQSAQTGYSFGMQPLSAADPSQSFNQSVPTLSGNTNFSGSFNNSFIVSENEPNVSDDPLHKLISVQSFMGVFSLNDIFASVVGKELAVLKQESSRNGWDENAWATAVAVVFLSEKLSERIEAWELIHKKAIKWLEKHHGSYLNSMLAAASKMLM